MADVNTIIEDKSETNGNYNAVLNTKEEDDPKNVTYKEINPITTDDAIICDGNIKLKSKLDTMQKYTNSKPMPTTIGGLEEGTTFNQKNIKDLITELLYPYYRPNITSFTASPDPNTLLEDGTSVSSVTLSIIAEMGTHPVSKAEIYMNGSKLDTINPGSTTEDGIAHFIYKYSRPITANTTFKAIVYDNSTRKHNYTESDVLTYTFIDPIYYGVVSSSTSMTDYIIRSKRKDIVQPENYTIDVTTVDQKVFFAVPSTWDITKIVDQNGFDITSSYTKSTVQVMTALGYAKPYTCFESNPFTQNNFSITFRNT